jgi:hypothetical protein
VKLLRSPFEAAGADDGRQSGKQSIVQHELALLNLGNYL